jgi:hypothetical protein
VFGMFFESFRGNKFLKWYFCLNKSRKDQLLKIKSYGQYFDRLIKWKLEKIFKGVKNENIKS